MPPQLVAKVLNTVSLCLRPNFTLREKRRGEERRREERRWLTFVSIIRCTFYRNTYYRNTSYNLQGFILHSFAIPKNDSTKHRDPCCAVVARV